MLANIGLEYDFFIKLNALAYYAKARLTRQRRFMMLGPVGIKR
jgi:hypothetical protein